MRKISFLASQMINGRQQKRSDASQQLTLAQGADAETAEAAVVAGPVKIAAEICVMLLEQPWNSII